MSAENPTLDRPSRKDDSWPAPKQLVSWLTVVALVCAALMWAGSATFASKDDLGSVKSDVHDLSTDIKYIRVQIDSLTNPRRGQ